MNKPSSRPIASRPLSPHLGNYRLPLLPLLSIMHRMTGVALAFGTLLIAAWLLALGLGEAAYRQFTVFMTSPFGILLLLGWSLALFYHGFNGIRHLFWDVGLGLAVPQAEAGGWLVAVLSLGSTALLWLCLWLL